MTESNAKLFPYETLKQLCLDAFQKFGFSADEADQIQDALLTADLFGIQSHGMQRMVRYHKGIKSGLIKINAKPEILFETPISAIIDGHAGMGQLISVFAMEKAIQKAKVSGVGIVSVRNSNHYGISSYYAKMACEEGLIGYSSTNSEALMVPTGSRKAMIGTNPQGWAVPTEEYPFIFDAATTVVTRGKVEMYNKMQKPMPDGWCVDEKGLPTNDAARVLRNFKEENCGGILPLGGSSTLTGSHKGFGNGIIAELFSSIISLGTTSAHVNKTEESGPCHSFMAINPKFFGDEKAIKHHFTEFLQELRNAPVAEGADRICTHGELEAESLERTKRDGIPVLEATMVEVKELCHDLGLDFHSYFGDYEPKRPDGMFANTY